MERERWHEVERAFDGALDQPEEARAAWLLARWPDDAALRDEVAAMLEAHARPGGLLDVDVGASMRARADARVRGRRIGPYRLQRELGRGGMGVVYLAERDDGAYRQQVAIKLLRSSPEADEVHERFLAERQILASLAHPNVAQLLDGGVTDGQLPYLVMEYVDGLPITEHCDRHRLGLRARLALFQRVCEVVHHAHQNLVIHRDLKPSNVYVTVDGHVKLLDFGIAKLLSPDVVGAKPPETTSTTRLMTPDYASPEQVRGEALTTASDVYALGVVLYELLSGHRPYRVGNATPAELQAAVCDREPPLPSASVDRTETVVHADGTHRTIAPATVAAARGGSPEWLRRELRGDLDDIVMMALRKERERRYGSADMLAADLQRYLDGLPVMAHRDSRWYRARKFLRRHRVEAAAGFLVAASLVGGVAVASMQARLARQERDRAADAMHLAEQSRGEAEEVTRFLLELFAAGDPGQPGYAEISARDLLRQGEQRAAQLGQPLVRARMEEAIGRVYVSRGELGRAHALLERALAARTATLGDTNLVVAGTRALLADVLRRQGRYPEAEAQATTSLAVRRAVQGADHPDVAASLHQLAGLAIYRGDLAGAERFARQALALRVRALGAEDSLVATSLTDVGAILARRGHADSAERIYEEVIALRRRVHGDRHPYVAQAIKRLADFRSDYRRAYASADSLYRAAIDIQVETLGAGSAAVADSRSNLALALMYRGRHAEAESLHALALGAMRRLYGPENARVAEFMSRTAGLLRARGRLAEAESVQREAVAMYARLLGPRHTIVAGALGGLADLLLERGDVAAAEAAARQAFEIRRELFGDAPLVAGHATALAAIVERRGRYAEAEALLLDARRMLLRQGPDYPGHAGVLRQLVALYDRWDRPAEAERHRIQLARFGGGGGG